MTARSAVLPPPPRADDNRRRNVSSGCVQAPASLGDAARLFWLAPSLSAFRGRLRNVISRHSREHVSRYLRAMLMRNFMVSLTGGSGQGGPRLLYDSSLCGELASLQIPPRDVNLWNASWFIAGARCWLRLTCCLRCAPARVRGEGGDFCPLPTVPPILPLRYS